MTIAEILRAGKARLLERGWCQGDEKAIFGDGKFGYCAATAMEGRADDTDFTCGEFLRQANHISGSLGDWNDAPERTLEDVLAAYDKAIAAAEANDNERRG